MVQICSHRNVLKAYDAEFKSFFEGAKDLLIFRNDSAANTCLALACCFFSRLLSSASANCCLVRLLWMPPFETTQCDLILRHEEYVTPVGSSGRPAALTFQPKGSALPSKKKTSLALDEGAFVEDDSSSLDSTSSSATAGWSSLLAAAASASAAAAVAVGTAEGVGVAAGAAGAPGVGDAGDAGDAGAAAGAAGAAADRVGAGDDDDCDDDDDDDDELGATPSLITIEAFSVRFNNI
jgi:hypothetical protein